ncbi:hypothetical protein D3C71_920260 [compost metagenome]
MTVQYQDIADIATRVISTTQETAKSPGLEVISWIRCSKPICESALFALPPAAAAMKISCSMTLTFVVCGVKGCC